MNQEEKTLDKRDCGETDFVPNQKLLSVLMQIQHDSLRIDESSRAQYEALIEVSIRRY